MTGTVFPDATLQQPRVGYDGRSEGSAMPSGGEVRIVTERLEQRTATSDSPGPGTYVRVRVEDDGHGMPEEVLQKSVRSFLHDEGETGTGIGLSQVHAFTQMVGGQVRIASERGVGTTVALLFPEILRDA